MIGVKMGNVTNIARKEFQDLLSSKMVLVVLIGYAFVVLCQIYFIYDVLSGGMGSTQIVYGSNLGMAFGNLLISMLTNSYGPILGIMIGCTSIASERHGNALNTLIVKPLYRDTIINGKLLGSLAFLTLVICAIIIFYTSSLLILFGDAFAPTFGDYFLRLPIIFMFSIILIAIFMAISMFMATLIKNQAFAMVMSTIILYISVNIEYLAKPFSKMMFPVNDLQETHVYNLIIGSTPTSYLQPLKDNIFNISINALDAFQLVLPDMIKFALFLVIACVFSYISFMMRDIS
jgi:ABC-2 type transport system permease protein